MVKCARYGCDNVRPRSQITMSFWPFSNSISTHLLLQKFLETVTDIGSVTCDDLVSDAVLSQEVLSELHNIKLSYSGNYPGLQFSNTDPSATTLDAVSLLSLNNDIGGVLSKDARGAKLVEILLQPHVLTGLLEHIVASVDFFHELSQKEEAELERLVAGEELSEVTEEENSNPSDGLINQTSDSDSDAEEAGESTEPAESAEDRTRRIILTASDILAIDLWVISNRIIETPVIMNKLWLILKLENLRESLPSVTYLVHILDQLMDANSIELLNFIRRQPDLVDTFLGRIEIPMLMDFLLRVIQTDKPDSPTGILETLHSQGLIDKLVDGLKPDDSQWSDRTDRIANHQLFFRQTAAADFIKALVTISSNTALAVVLETNIGPNQLTRELVSPRIVNIIINDIMLYRFPNNEPNKYGIHLCVGIIIELIRKNNSDYDLNCGLYSSMLQLEGGEVNSYVMYQWLKDFDQNPPGSRDPIYLGDMLDLFSESLHKFVELMNLPARKESRLGFTKFRILELIAELLHCSNMILLNSKRIRKVIHARDHVRLQQSTRLKLALEASLLDELVNDVTSGLDDISLENIHFDRYKDDAQRHESEVQGLVDQLNAEEASDDDEPSISPENPFVCAERDGNIRELPCVGDYFKTKLLDLRILHNIISKFTQYPWHNFFHNVVFDLIQQIFNGKLNSYNSFLIVDLFDVNKCNLTEMIVLLYVDSEPRPGYMGHLILISEEVVKFTSLYKPDLISPIIVDAISSEKWDVFVNGVLLKTREVYNVVLGAETDDGDKKKDYGFDLLAVGFLDLECDKKSPIILGDRNNHEDFIAEEDTMEAEVPEVRIENVQTEETSDDDEGYQENNYLDNLSGSSLSDDDDDDDHELRRVPRHS